MNIPRDVPPDPADPLPPEDRDVDGAKGFMDFNEGEVYTGIGRTIRELIMKTHNFIVFLDEFGGIQWGYSNVAVLSGDYSLVSNRVARLETQSRFLYADGGPDPSDPEFVLHQHALFSARRLIAEGISRLLDSGSLEAAQGILDTAEKWINQRSRSYSRGWLLFPFSLLALGGLVTFFILTFCWGQIPPAGDSRLLLLGALLGGLGALVSSVIFNDRIPIDATSGRTLHRLEALLRWSVGVAAGLAVQLLINGDILLGFLSSHNAPPVAGLVFSLLAGLSEIFFPTLLRSFDNSLEHPSDPSPKTQ